ncbi:DUF5685 family protein [Aureibacter tunicatorum]|uniref:Uncharacterized protein n=1 Tax=Aureibacter tunicatorum TaxID=866807 RepID=A0AAE3XPR5_9BACT|nr:DUF5685 family protein [Aureibacter tunicatorum]MDR6239858.1 hypothetical protein [Aureibacter tunicatorum]BDD04333.1 hypothetical protein AUTU_18160 [Aureibacter tunicatorum]
MFGVMKATACKSKSQEEVDWQRFNYCGTCKSIGVMYGHQSRLFLNYDIVFLTSLLQAISGKKEDNTVRFKNSKLFCWDMPRLDQISIIQKYTSSLHLFLASIKVKDNIIDGNKLSRIKWTAFNVSMSGNFFKSKDALAALGLPVDMLNGEVEKNFKAEQVKGLSLSEYSKYTSEVCKIIFEHGAKLANSDFSNKFKEIGASFGKLVYCLDARNDYEEDRRNGSFNPMINNTAIQVKDLDRVIMDEVNFLIGQLKGLGLPNGVLDSYISRFRILLSKETIEEKQKKSSKISDLFCLPDSFEVCDFCCCDGFCCGEGGGCDGCCECHCG